MVADETIELLRAMANRRRLILLSLLLDGERNVSALQALSGHTQACVSQHLAVMRKARLVAAQRQGHSVVYRLRPQIAGAVRELIGACLAPT